MYSYINLSVIIIDQFALLFPIYWFYKQMVVIAVFVYLIRSTIYFVFPLGHYPNEIKGMLKKLMRPEFSLSRQPLVASTCMARYQMPFWRAHHLNVQGE